MLLSDLVGTHWLSGVERDTVEVEDLDSIVWKCSALMFTLDGQTYRVVEAPGGQMRMGDLQRMAGRDLRHTFEPLKVVCVLRPDNRQMMDMFSAESYEPVVTIGTQWNGEESYFIADYRGPLATRPREVNIRDLLAQAKHLQARQKEALASHIANPTQESREALLKANEECFEILPSLIQQLEKRVNSEARDGLY